MEPLELEEEEEEDGLLEQLAGEDELLEGR